MNVKNRAFLLVSLIILLLSGFLLHEGISHFNAEIDSAILEQEKLIDGIINDIKTYSFQSYLFKIRHFVDHNEEIQQAFARRDRDRLYRLCLPQYAYLQGENQFFHALDFNLPDGTVFLRVQNPDLYGDNISETRQIVKEVHRSRELCSGFDIGKHGALFWVACPVVVGGVYVGAVEFGIEAKQLESALMQSFGGEVSSVLRANQWQKAELVKHGYQEHGDYVLMTRGNSLFDQVAGNLDFASQEDQVVRLNNKPHVLHSCAVLEDFRKNRIGRLIQFQDISPQVERRKDFIFHTVFLTAIILIILFFILYFSFGNLIGRLEEYARENTNARRDLQKAHDKLEDRVKERTVDLAKANARLEDEVTIRRNAEAKLKEQRKFLETVIESLTHPFYVVDAETWQIVLANKAACAIAGAESFFGQTCHGMTHHFSHPCSGKEHPCPLDAVKKTGKPVIVEHVHHDGQGNERFMEIYAYPVFAKDGSVQQIVESTVDITDRKRSEDERENLRTQLLASQKMEAVGVLAGGVAHDFNNILTTILGYSQIMALKLEEDHPMRAMVEDIYDAAEKAAGLTRQLLAFSRKQVMEMKLVRLNDIVENIAKMLGRLIGENISMRLALQEGIGSIRVDVGQIEQVIMNLVINARDAMPGGGELTVETGQIELDEQYTRVHHGVQPGFYAMLTVTDTGVGMRSEELDTIFEPFYTTKGRGKGTGLGLATVYGIVRQHQGHIYVYSEPGQGTTFKIYLPIVEGTAEAIFQKKDNRMMPQGTETILIVDDDASIRRLIKDTLEPLGYDLLEAGSGEDALAIYRKGGRKIDLVLTDLIMPGMNGQELIDILKSEQPDIRSILMSGYTDNIIAHQGILKPEVIFVNKPLLPIALASKIRDVLDSRNQNKQGREELKDT